MSIGLQHAFEPDHISAIGTQLTNSKISKSSLIKDVRSIFTKSSLVGALWGAGHMTTLVVMGLLVYYLALQTQTILFVGFEFLVGVMLVFLGITAIVNKKILLHKHPHLHPDGRLHYEEHNHFSSIHEHGHKSYLIGLVHGLAGSGSLIVLTASIFENVDFVIIFTLLFGLGSMLGMILVSGFIGIPIYFAKRIGLIQKILRFSTGTITLVLGLNIIYQLLTNGILF